MTQETLALSYDQMRTDIAEAIGISVAEVEPEESLVDLGLDSIQVMNLLMKWGEVIEGLDFSRFMEAETLDEWWAIAQEAQAK